MNAKERCCRQYGRDIGLVERVGRRDTCLHCDASLHCCLNCLMYEPTFHNHCREPHAERQVDKTAGNFCDYFAFRTGHVGGVDSGRKAGARAQLDALFPKKK